MRVYLDSSALLKRAVTEAESAALERTVLAHLDDQDALVSSSLAWIEVSRAVRIRFDGLAPSAVNAAVEDALSGINEWPLAANVVSVARRISPPLLRSLDAIHLATAVLLDADVMITYDDRLAEAAQASGVSVAAPAQRAAGGS